MRRMSRGMIGDDDLPIDAVLPQVIAALRDTGRAVLQAPPGAGKTTRVPLAMLAAGFGDAGRIVMLEPRRLAARAAAERMAGALGETPGERVGYRIRGQSVVGPLTRIEVVTEGILTRMIQSDPELRGIAAVIFDEFHERSLQADLGLALLLECRAALRPDLQLLVMSATLDAAPVAALLDAAPVITAQGRSFEVELVWHERPQGTDARLVPEVAGLTLKALAETTGGVLVFLPGAAEIRAVGAALARRLPGGIVVRPLHGALPFAAQRAALAPVATGRKVVLASAIAETSLTLPDIRVVVDAGLARRARHDPGSGMGRLVTERVTRAEAAQRAGRAGRVAPGRCYRMWSRAEEGALAEFPPPEISVADLAGLALELALWGSADLPFLTPPPEGPLAAARELLQDLGALDDRGGITAHGRALARLPLHPRLAHMVTRAGRPAAMLAALLSERDPLPGAGADLGLRLRALAGRDPDPGFATIRKEAGRIARALPAGAPPEMSPGAMAALAFPDRIAMRRGGGDGRWLLSGGKGAAIDPGDPLAGEDFLVAVDLDGDLREARIRRALALSETELRAIYPDRIAWQDRCDWSRRDRRVLAERQERFGALVLSRRPWPDPPAEALCRAICEGLRDLAAREGDLGLTGEAARLRSRVMLVRAAGHELPDMSDAALLEGLEDWLAPHLVGVRSLEDWRRFDPLPALRGLLDWAQMQLVEAEAPARFTTPLGRRIAVDYDGPQPGIEVRLQEMFGVTRHPTVASRPLRITLLSPAGRPVQVTADLPEFWASSYAEVRKDMRGRYPRHPWPEDPTLAEPTLRAKPRGS